MTTGLHGLNLGSRVKAVPDRWRLASVHRRGSGGKKSNRKEQTSHIVSEEVVGVRGNYNIGTKLLDLIQKKKL